MTGKWKQAINGWNALAAIQHISHARRGEEGSHEEGNRELENFLRERIAPAYAIEVDSIGFGLYGHHIELKTSQAMYGGK